MERLTTKVKKWGNSFGVILPKKIVDADKIKEGMEITIVIQPSHKTKVKDVFGILKGKLKKRTQEILDEVDKELWPEDE